MKVGEVWRLKAHIKFPSRDQININHTDEFQHYDLIPALKITGIRPNDMSEAERLRGWDGHYIIYYQMIFGFERKDIEPMVIHKNEGWMSSGCLFRNYECVYDLVAA